MKAHTAAVVGCSISHDSSRAVTIGKDKMLCEWDLEAPKLIRKFTVPEPLSIAYLPDGKTVLVGTANDSAGVWDLEKQERIKQLDDHRKPVRAVCVSPKGDMAFTTGDEDVVNVWFLPGWKRSGSIPTSGKDISVIAVSPNGRILACTGPDEFVQMFDSRDGRPLGRYAVNAPGRALTFIDEGRTLAIARAPEPLPRPYPYRAEERGGRERLHRTLDRQR